MTDQQPLLHDHDVSQSQNTKLQFNPVTEIIPYDFDDFNTFHARHGYIKDGHFDSGRSPEDFNRLLQSWLYFGLLAEFLGRPITTADIDCCSHDQQVLLNDFAKRAQSLGLNTRNDRLDHLFGLLSLAGWWCTWFDTVDIMSPVAPSCLAVRTLISSLAIILLPNEEEYEVLKKDALTNVVEDRSPSDWPEYLGFRDRFLRIVNPSPISEDQDFSLSSVQLLTAHMQENSWCLHQIKDILRSYDYATCAHLASIKRPPHRSHQLCEGASKCVADNAQMSNYVTRHAIDGCACAHLLAPKDEIISIIRRGRIPLVSFVKTPNGQLDILACERTSRTRYVALSHVWADGFGNPSENSLPECILRQLLAWMRNLPLPSYEVGIVMAGRRCDASHMDIIHPPTWFWMDTLCIPVGEDFTDVRHAAINDMANIYVGASQVLVLDAELLKLSASTHRPGRPTDSSADQLDALNALACIAFSTWSRRSWTFQEGALGRECVFQLSGTAVNVANEWSPSGARHPLFAKAFSFPDKTDPVQQHIFKALYERVWDMLQRKYDLARHRAEDNLYHRPFPLPGRAFGSISLLSDMAEKNNRRHHGEILVNVWNELTLRSTTKSKDIHIIMANLLDFDAGTVMRHPRADRLTVMLRSIEGIPFSIFYNDGPRRNATQDHSLRWLPEEPSNYKLQPGQYMQLMKPGLSAAVQDGSTTSLFFRDSESNDRCKTYHKSLKMLLDIQTTRSPGDIWSGQSQYGTLIVFPTPKPTEPLDPKKKYLLKGACFKVQGYCVATFKGKRSPFKDRQAEHLLLKYDCPVTVEATPVKDESAEVLTSERRPYEAVPFSTFYLITCDLYRYPKIKRRDISTSQLAAGLIYVLMYFIGYAILLAILLIVTVIIIPMARKEKPRAFNIILTIFYILSSTALFTLVLACSAALAHHERCLLLEDFSSGNKTEKRVKWTNWILGPLYVCLGQCHGFMEEIMSKSQSYQELSREREKENELRLESPAEEIEWVWAEERGIPRVPLDTEERGGSATRDCEVRVSLDSAAGHMQQDEEGEAIWGTSPEDVPLTRMTYRAQN